MQLRAMGQVNRMTRKNHDLATHQQNRVKATGGVLKGWIDEWGGRGWG